MLYPDKFDVIVIGGGHAGTEACLAADSGRHVHAPESDNELACETQ